MQEFLNIILSMPTVVYTVLMGVLALYWVTVIMGAVDLDLFDIDVDIDADVDLDVEVDADVDIDVDAESVAGSTGIIVSLLSALGLVGIPLTISLSILVLYNWSLNFLFSYYLGAGTEAISTLFGVGVMAVSLVVSTFMTSLTVRPLRPLFRSAVGAKAGQALVGMTVKVLSGSVSDTFGRAEAGLEGSVVNFSIRCEAENNLSKGDEALIIGYDEAAHVYYVEPLGMIFGEDDSESSSRMIEADFDVLEKAEEEAKEAVEEEVGAKRES